MAHEVGVASFVADEACVRKLAQLFAAAIPVRIPVKVTALRPGGRNLGENTIIAYGTPTEVLFSSTLPLELDDRVHLQNSNGSLKAEASVVAVQYQDGRKAVAARFLKQVGNWIIKR